MSPIDYMALGAREPGSAAFHVVVDTPAGSGNKYKYDEERGLFLLHKRLPVGAAFPFDFGFIPGTEGDDGDALDVIVLHEEATFVGCVIPVRLLGVIEESQTEKGRAIRNDRLIGTPETKKIRPAARSLGDLPKKLIEQLEHFFAAYNEAEGRRFAPIGRRGPSAARAIVERGARRWARSHGGTAAKPDAKPPRRPGARTRGA
jgi:inorganic pyrophosphatase